ncbi:hypothetical protein PR048_030803 [Dryococelus australis]|uniref:Uncharacterized protein n=1 Tax=Dryococelus australis TaxID=614101 RepID=A0ABQ9GCH8_9NEOP|nr:hypothetical protein PR048_030803 [Dryococelus australis]
MQSGGRRLCPCDADTRAMQGAEDVFVHVTPTRGQCRVAEDVFVHVTPTRGQCRVAEDVFVHVTLTWGQCRVAEDVFVHVTPTRGQCRVAEDVFVHVTPTETDDPRCLLRRPLVGYMLGRLRIGLAHLQYAGKSTIRTAAICEKDNRSTPMFYADVIFLRASAVRYTESRTYIKEPYKHLPLANRENPGETEIRMVGLGLEPGSSSMRTQHFTYVPVYLESFPVFEAGRRGNDKVDNATHIKCAIAAKRRALNWPAVLSTKDGDSAFCLIVAGGIWAALNTEVLRADGGEARGWGRREIPEKTRRPVALSGTIPTCGNPGATPPGIEPGSPRWEASSLTTTTSRRLFLM